MSRDPYEVLGVSRDADKDEIKKAYHKLAKQYHPDSHPDDPEAAKKMNEINQAYDMLTNPDKYSRFGPGSSYGTGNYGYGNSSSGRYGGGYYRGYYGNSGNSGRTDGQYGNQGSWDPFEEMFRNASAYQGNMSFEERSRMKEQYHRQQSFFRRLLRGITIAMFLSFLIRGCSNIYTYRDAYPGYGYGYDSYSPYGYENPANGGTAGQGSGGYGSYGYGNDGNGLSFPNGQVPEGSM